MPVVCCASVGTNVNTVNVAATSNRADIFMAISVGAMSRAVWVIHGQRATRDGMSRGGLIQINEGPLRVNRYRVERAAIPAMSGMPESGRMLATVPFQEI